MPHEERFNVDPLVPRKTDSGLLLDWADHPNPLLRIAGRDDPAGVVLQQALGRGHLPVQTRTNPAANGHLPASPADDYAQVNPSLVVRQGVTPLPEPATGVGYAGLTPQQRWFFYEWLMDPVQAAAPAYRQLYLAQLETWLFEDEPGRSTAQDELHRLLHTAAWCDDENLARSTLLAGWLTQDGGYLADVVESGQLPQPLVTIAVSWQALLQTALTSDEVLALAAVWSREKVELSAETDGDLLRMRLESIGATLGAPPLAYALAQYGAENDDVHSHQTPRPWRCVHRDLRIALPQLDLRPILEPILAEVWTAPLAAAAPTETIEAEATAGPDPGWHLVLEFGQSRSQYFEYVLAKAQKLSGYQQLMDENRHMLHRIVFRKREMRRFWQLWDYVQNWSSTKVYVNGQEMEHWKIWPYSQYLR